MGENQLDAGKPAGRRHYAHAFVPLDLPRGGDTFEVEPRLRRGVTVKGRLVGPDGKPPPRVSMLSRLNVELPHSTWLGRPALVREGRFELHGLDSAQSYPVCFLDAKNKLAAAVTLSAKQAGEEVEVRLVPCGSATTRVVDTAGKPLARQRLHLQFVMIPGPALYEARSREGGELASDDTFVANIDALHYWDGPLSDAEGKATFEALIPGATYRTFEPTADGNVRHREFKLGAGENVKLPDLIVSKPTG
jgi:hypothetical protein